jgi:hypothetical protein
MTRTRPCDLRKFQLLGGDPPRFITALFAFLLAW